MLTPPNLVGNVPCSAKIFSTHKLMQLTFVPTPLSIGPWPRVSSILPRQKHLFLPDAYSVSLTDSHGSPRAYLKPSLPSQNVLLGHKLTGKPTPYTSCNN